MFGCPDCGRQFEKLISLSLHYRKGHKKSAEELIIHLRYGGVHPTCKCGCGEKTKFYDISRGFGEWKRGHRSRTKNNWGHNERALENSIETRRKMFENGELEVWNKGETKETDERIAKLGRRGSVTLMSSLNERVKRSHKMKRQWETGNLQSLTGSAHPQWKGGVSQLSALCHGNNRLYQEWKYPKLLATQFKCERCRSSNELHVHHSEELMSEIIYRFRWELFPDVVDELEWEQKLTLVESVVNYHVQNDIKGEVLCRTCHDQEHQNLNF